jgi:hypothetical protein
VWGVECEWCFYKEKRRSRHTERMPCEDGDRDCSDVSISQELLAIPGAEGKA